MKIKKKCIKKLYIIILDSAQCVKWQKSWSLRHYSQLTNILLSTTSQYVYSRQRKKVYYQGVVWFFLTYSSGLRTQSCSTIVPGSQTNRSSISFSFNRFFLDHRHHQGQIGMSRGPKIICPIRIQILFPPINMIF